MMVCLSWKGLKYLFRDKARRSMKVIMKKRLNAVVAFKANVLLDVSEHA